MHSRFDNSFILSPERNKRTDFEDETLCMICSHNYFICGNRFVQSLNFVVHYYAYLFPTEAEFLWLFTHLIVFSGKIERDYFLFLPTGEWGYCQLPSRSKASFKTSVCIPSVRKEMGADTRAWGFNCVGKSRSQRDPNINAYVNRRQKFYPLYF